MNIAEARIAIVQDDENYLDRVNRFFEEAKEIRTATTLAAGLVLLDELASGQVQAHLLALDENLIPDTHDGSDGVRMYDRYLELRLDKTIPVVSISSDAKLPITQVSSSVAKLLEYIEAM